MAVTPKKIPGKDKYEEGTKSRKSVRAKTTIPIITAAWPSVLCVSRLKTSKPLFLEERWFRFMLLSRNPSPFNAQVTWLWQHIQLKDSSPVLGLVIIVDGRDGYAVLTHLGCRVRSNPEGCVRAWFLSDGQYVRTYWCPNNIREVLTRTGYGTDVGTDNALQIHLRKDLYSERSTWAPSQIQRSVCPVAI